MVLKPEKDAVLLDHLYLHPHSQGKRIGTAVIGLIIAQADASGLPLRVGALRGSDANRFYLRHHFKLVNQSEFDNHYVRAVTGVS